VSGSGADTLIGNAGGNTLNGTAGTALADYGLANLTVNLSTNKAAVNGSGTSDTLVGFIRAMVSGSGDTVVAGSGADTLMASGGNDTLIAASGTDTLSASGSADTLVAGNGTDTLSAAGSGDFYQFGSGNGQTTIVNGAPGGMTASNELDFGSGIADNDLWLLQSGNNLQIDLMGSTSSVTISNWFAGAGHQLQEITAGGLKLDGQVAQLVQAMATFAANNPGFNPTTATQAPNDPTLQATIAAAWHH
jgi:Ca2+-binding RTX toxin-like protein